MKLEGHQPSPDQCRHKWHLLTQEYQKNKAEAEASGSVPLWQYYTRVRHVLSQVGMPPAAKIAAMAKSNSGQCNTFPLLFTFQLVVFKILTWPVTDFLYVYFLWYFVTPHRLLANGL